MAIAYSIIASNTVATTTDTVTTGSFTPANGSLLVAIAPLLIPGHRSAAMTIADSAGLTWTSRVFREDPANPADYPTALAIWTAPVTTGTSMTVTTDCNPTGSDGNGRQSLYIIEVTGHNTTTPVPQTFNAGASTTYNTSYSGNFGSAPAASSLCLAAVSNSTERPNTSSKITTGTGWTQIAEFFDSAMYNTSQIQARTGSTSSAIVWNNINSTYAHSIGAIEIAVAAEAGGVSATFGVTIDPVTVTTNGDLILNGIFAQTIPAVTLAASGDLILNGILAQTIPAVTLAASGNLGVAANNGVFAAAIGPVTLVAASTVTQSPITGTFGVTLAPVTLAAYQTVPPAGSGQRDSDPVLRRPVQQRRKGRIFHILVDRLKTEVKKPGPLRKKRKKLAKLIAEEAAEAVGGLLSPAEVELEKEVRHDLEAVPLTELHTEGWSELQDRLMQVIAEAEETAQQLRAEQEEEDDLLLFLAS